MYVYLTSMTSRQTENFTCPNTCALYFTAKVNTPHECLGQVFLKTFFQGILLNSNPMEAIVNRSLYKDTGYLSPFLLKENYTFLITNNNPIGGARNPFYIYIFDDVKIPYVDVYDALYVTSTFIWHPTTFVSAEECITVDDFYVMNGTDLICIGGSDSCNNEKDAIAVIEAKQKSVIKVLAPLVSIRSGDAQIRVDAKQGLNGKLNAGGQAIATSPGYTGNSSSLFAHPLRGHRVIVSFMAKSDIDLDIETRSAGPGNDLLAAVSVTRSSGVKSLEKDISGTASQAYKSVLGSDARLEWKPATASAFAHGNVLVSFRVTSGTGVFFMSSAFIIPLYIFVTTLVHVYFMA